MYELITITAFVAGIILIPIALITAGYNYFKNRK